MSLFNEIDRINALRPKIKDWKGETVKYAQEKKNGYRLTITIDENGLPFAFGKKEDYWEKLIWKFKGLRGILPRGTIVDGELYAKGKNASDVPTAINEQWDSLRFAAFGMPYLELEDIRSHDLAVINNGLKEFGFEVPILIPITVGSKTEDVEDYLFKICEQELLEGFVLKNFHYSEWHKLKVTQTCDVVITKWVPGTGLMSGLMGALVGSVYKNLIMGVGEQVEITNIGTGFDEEDREKFTKEFSIGKVAEVEYQAVAAKGRLQHCRFIRFRDDKRPEECTIDQIE